MIILKPEEMRNIDSRVIEAGFPEILLMEAAGHGVAELAQEILAEGRKEVLVFVGKGNNGGDGLVAARFLDMWGYRVKVILLALEDKISGSSLINYRLCRLRGIEIIPLAKLAEEELSLDLNKTDLVIDAILGTGLKGELREPFLTLIDLINQSGKRVLAVDIPSGVDGEKGRIHGTAIKADFTATMAFPKLGLLIYPGRDYTGRLKVIDLGMPDRLIEDIHPNHFILTKKEGSDLLPSRLVTGHKGTFGKLGVIGGSKGMVGAPALSGMAALKTGAGLVRVAVPASIQSMVAGFYPELMTMGLDDTEGILNEGALVGIEELARSSDLIAVGPGLGRSNDLTRIINKLIRGFEIPLILDADGLNAIKDLDILKERKSPLILTPHPGEMARLLGVKISSVQEDRIKVARNFASKYGVYLILKGAGTVIALPDGRVYLNLTGNSGLATAGSGDVLTGIIASLIAQGLKIEKAVVLGPYLHGFAADLAKEDLTSYSLIAGDILNYLPLAIKKLSN